MNSFGGSAVYPAMGNNKALAITAAVSLVVIIFSFAHEVRNLPALVALSKNGANRHTWYCNYQVTQRPCQIPYSL